MSLFYDYLMRTMEYQRNPQEAKKRRAAFKIVNQVVQDIESDQILDDPMTWQDLSLFCGQTDPTCSLSSIVSRTSTELGKVMLACMLIQPKSDVAVLKKRQHIIKTILNDHHLYGQLIVALERFKKIETAHAFFLDA